MRIKLEKLALPSESELEALSPAELRDLVRQWREKIEVYQGLLFKVRRQFFGPKSERGGKSKPPPTTPAARGETIKLPSERYPNAPIQVDNIDFVAPPSCQACGSAMQDSGMTEDSEYLTVSVKEYRVVQQKRHKHRCQKCHGSIQTAPSLPRVIPGGSYSDEMIVDASLSKYCDLIPMERYCQMAARNGFPGLPPHSLIQASTKLATFLLVIYELIKEETLNTDVLLADETPHRMLEGDERKRWYLWGFLNQTACFFECHDTRSGDVSTEVLKSSNCRVLVSDVYSGYKKSTKAANELRALENKPLIETAYCNAHARRQFYSDAQDGQENKSADAQSMVDQYELIYELNDEAKAPGLSDQEVLEKRAEMKPIFEAMQAEALKKIDTYPRKSQMGTAYGYFLKNYDGLTLCLTNAKVPLDNNASERLLRSHVVGRKTWYGTHSRKGAWTAAVHFTIVETCKLNGVNPRQYYMDIIDQIHAKEKPLTPSQYKQKSTGNTC